MADLSGIVGLGAGILGVPGLFVAGYKFIFKWIDKQLKANQLEITKLETDLLAAQVLAEAERTKRISEVDTERTARMAAQEEASRERALRATAEERLRSQQPPGSTP